MVRNIIFFTFFAVSLFFLGTYLQKFNETAKTSVKVEQEQKIQREQMSLVQVGEFRDGAKLYKDELQKDCKMSGFSLARKKSKAQWEEIAKEGKLADTITSLCPNAKFNNIWTPDIYEYLHDNATASKS